MEVGVSLWDAFTEVRFSGNVAGVITRADELSLGQMQSMATELNAPTTGFVTGFEAGPPPVFSVRYFTPRTEIDLCGHVTVAVFSALAAEGRLVAREGGTLAYQKTAAGMLPVLLHPAGSGRVTVQMEQRRPTYAFPNIAARELVELLGGTELHRHLPPEVVSTGLRHLLVPFPQVEALGLLSPDFGRLGRLSRDLGVDTVCAFAVMPGTNAVRARDFCPGIGADEEPASGTTSGALACYLIGHGQVDAGRSGLVTVEVHQGVEMGRPSRIEVDAKVDGREIQRVWARGRATMALQGKMMVDRSDRSPIHGFSGLGGAYGIVWRAISSRKRALRRVPIALIG